MIAKTRLPRVRYGRDVARYIVGPIKLSDGFNLRSLDIRNARQTVSWGLEQQSTH
jgi:hypothetical protein